MYLVKPLSFELRAYGKFRFRLRGGAEEKIQNGENYTRLFITLKMCITFLVQLSRKIYNREENREGSTFI